MIEVVRLDTAVTSYVLRQRKSFSKSTYPTLRHSYLPCPKDKYFLEQVEEVIPDLNKALEKLKQLSYKYASCLAIYAIARRDYLVFYVLFGYTGEQIPLISRDLTLICAELRGELKGELC